MTRLSSRPILCIADSTGHVTLTYNTPAQFPPRTTRTGRGQQLEFNPSIKADRPLRLHHRVPIRSFAHRHKRKPRGRRERSRHPERRGRPRHRRPEPAHVPVVPAGPGGGSASVGATKLTSTPTLFAANSSGMIGLTYTAPGDAADKRHRPDHGAGPDRAIRPSSTPTPTTSRQAFR